MSCYVAGDGRSVGRSVVEGARVSMTQRPFNNSCCFLAAGWAADDPRQLGRLFHYASD